MATRPIAPEVGQFHHALSAYKLASSLRHRGMTNEEIKATEEIIEPLFKRIVKAPAFSPGDVLAKGEAILMEFGEFDMISTELFMAMIADLRRIVQ